MKQVGKRVMMKRNLCSLSSIILSLFCLLSCGIEAYYYIDYIPDGYVEMDRVYTARITLPSTGAEGYSNYFDNFIIFYRIYISGINFLAPVVTPQERRDINQTLDVHFNSIFSMTDKTSTTVNTSNLETFFSNRDYFQLTIEGSPNITSVLSNGSLGRSLVIDFPSLSGSRPTLTLSGTPDATYVLQRATTGPGISFRPVPDDYYFLNHADLYSNDNANNKEINADVAPNNNTATPQFTYVSMYIAAKGRSYEAPPRYIYSQPTFIGIFMLPDS